MRVRVGDLRKKISEAIRGLDPKDFPGELEYWEAVAKKALHDLDDLKDQIRDHHKGAPERAREMMGFDPYDS